MVGDIGVGHGHVGISRDHRGVELGYCLNILLLLPHLRFGRALGVDGGVELLQLKNLIGVCVQ